MNDTDPNAGPDPGATLRPGARGTPVAAGGKVWLFADYVPEPGPVWDALFDGNVLAGRYQDGDVLRAAVRLLAANHDVTPEEAAAAVCSADRSDLVTAVEAALLGPEREYRGWSDWVEVSLLANGIRPGDVPPRRRRDVVAQLVATGRALPASTYVSSAEYLALRSGLAGGGRK